MKDPLAKSNLKLSLLKEHCSSVVIRELDAGEDGDTSNTNLQKREILLLLLASILVPKKTRCPLFSFFVLFFQDIALMMSGQRK